MSGSIKYLASLLIAFASNGVLAALYNVTDLGTLGGNLSASNDINSSGQVVGWSRSSSGDRAFIFDSGSMSQLSTDGITNYAYGINDSGVVAGNVYDFRAGVTGVRSRITVWDNATTTYGTLGGDFSAMSAGAINSSNQIAGRSRTASGDTHAVFGENGELIDLGTLGSANYSQASGINDAGQVVGSSGGEAFIWDAVNGMVGIGSLGGISAGAQINNHGQIAGFSYSSADSNYRAFLWDDGVMTNLGALAGLRSDAYDINDQGQVVGSSRSGGADGDSYAMLWEDGEMINLNNLIDISLGWHLESARAINNSGVITGYGTINGEQRAFMLTTVPIPGAVWLFGSSLLGLVLVSRRKNL